MLKINRKGRHQVTLKSKHQAGVSLVELMVGLALSVVVTSAMVVLMGNSVGTTNRIIHSAQLSDELRNVMSMMSRDLRRSNYSANAIFCYGNSKCGASGGVAQQYGNIKIDGVDANDGVEGSCVSYTLDRNSDGDATNDAPGGFRLNDSSGVGVIEMWTGNGQPDCDSNNTAWIPLTDPGTVNVSEFIVDANGSFDKTFSESETTSFNNTQRQIRIQMEGALVLEEASGINMVSRRIEDIIYVRNDFITL